MFHEDLSCLSSMHRGHKNHLLSVLKSFSDRRLKVVTIDMEREFRVELEEDNSILCRNCRHRITSVDHIITMRGQHKHTFTNPAGTTYEIGCFSEAEGCLVFGEPTLEFTWFEGFGWSLAVCSHCLWHLGWLYQSSGDHFFGLILNNLIETAQTH